MSTAQPISTISATDEIVEQLLAHADGAYYVRDRDLSLMERRALREYLHPVVGFRKQRLWPIGDLRGAA